MTTRRRFGKAAVWRAVRAHFARVPGVTAAYVYGSAGRGRRPFQPHSDVDVAVLFTPAHGPRDPLRFRMDHAGRLSEAVAREVEVVVLNDAPCLLAYQVLKHGVRVLERDRRRCRRLEAELQTAYLDFLPVREIMTAGTARFFARGGHG